MDDKTQDEAESINMNGDEKEGGTAAAAPDEAGTDNGPADEFGDADPPIIISG